MALNAFGGYTPPLTPPAPTLPPGSGSGSPEGVQFGTPGQFYWDATGNNLWVKDTGSGLTGWVIVTSSGGGTQEIFTGTGTPEGTVTAAVGKMYWDPTAGTMWVKNTGSGNTGWIEAFTI